MPVEKRPELSDEVLLDDDQAIVSATQRLNERRITRGESPIVWKYFQYLALLFTEIYLDRYFRDPRALLLAINQRIAMLNEHRDEPDRIAMLDETADAWPQLNKIAFWMATGSGKTLLMHAHILQYRRLLEMHGRGAAEPDHPADAQRGPLSSICEFEKAGIRGDLQQGRARTLRRAGRRIWSH